MKEALVIINPISGTTNKEPAYRYLSSCLTRLGYSVHDVNTTKSGDATAFARDAISRACDLVVVMGGDGTVNEVAAAMIDSGVPMGVMPSGSGNGLARHLSIPLDMQEAAQIICRGHVEECDYALVNDLPFFCTSGVGFDAIVSEKFANSRRRGKMSYVRIALHEFLRYNPEQYTIIAGGEVITEKALLVAVCNCNQYGNNAYIAPHASMTDGLLDVTIIHHDNLVGSALSGIDMLIGNLDKGVRSTTLRVPAVTIVRSEAGPAHLDGDPVHLGRELNYRCHKGGLKIVCPRDADDFKPIITPLKAAVTDIRRDIRQIFTKPLS